ncbi:MAG: zf-HC2 domain-containing protein, partial [Candidatus Dormibacteraceae bacterium]
MSDQPVPDRMEQEVAAYVLDGLPPAEAQAVRLHLESCASCRELEQRLSRAVAAVPLSVDLVEPPARLRARILASAGATSPTPPVPRRKAVRGAHPRPSRWRWLVGPWPAPLRFPLRAGLAALVVA